MSRPELDSSTALRPVVLRLMAPGLMARGLMARGLMAPKLIAMGLVLVLGACSAGDGQGEIGGAIFAEDCAIDVPEYSLVPSLYAGQVIGTSLNVRVQRGSALEMFADGVQLHVADINDVRANRIGLPIEVTDDYEGPLQVFLHLNESCRSGFPSEYRQRPLILEAVAGQVVFNSIYAPEIDPANTEIDAELIGLTFVDRSEPERRFASIDGWFSFFYQRGRPAQRFP